MPRSLVNSITRQSENHPQLQSTDKNAMDITYEQEYIEMVDSGNRDILNTQNPSNLNF